MSNKGNQRLRSECSLKSYVRTTLLYIHWTNRSQHEVHFDMNNTLRLPFTITFCGGCKGYLLSHIGQKMIIPNGKVSDSGLPFYRKVSVLGRELLIVTATYNRKFFVWMSRNYTRSFHQENYERRRDQHFISVYTLHK